MFAAAQSENTFIAWLLRLVGFIVMFIGTALVFKPLKVLADVLPLAGRIVGAGTGFIAFLLSAVSATTIIALSSASPSSPSPSAASSSSKRPSKKQPNFFRGA